MLMRYGLIALCLFVAACDQESADTTPVAEAANPGEGLYQENCGSCHNGGVYKAPHRLFLGMMAPDAILASMDGGIMAEQANALSAAQKRAVAEHIAGRSLDAEVVKLPPPVCENKSLDLSQPPRQKGWGIDYRNSRFQPAATGGLTASDAPSLELEAAAQSAGT